MKKRMISLLLAIVMVLGMVPAMAPAASAASNMVAKVKAVGTGYADSKDNFIDIDGTKLYDGDTFKGSKGGTLTIDGNAVILNNFNHACNTGITISGDILYITIIGNNTIDCRSGNLSKVGGALCFEGTMHDSLTMKRGGVQAWGVWFIGGNYDIPSIYAVSDN